VARGGARPVPEYGGVVILRQSAGARRYRNSEEDLIVMRDAQGGCCAICQGAIRGDAGPLPIYRARQRIARREVQPPPWHGQGPPEVLLRAAEYLGWVPSPLQGVSTHGLSRDEAALELPQKQRHDGTGPEGKQGWGRGGR
jgi:hypothetical protein